MASAIAATFTGGRDGERAEATVAEAAIEQHEEAGEALAWGAGAVLLIAAAGLMRRERPARWLRLATAVAGVVVLALAFRAGHSGGVLVFQHGANVDRSPPAAGSASSKGDHP